MLAVYFFLQVQHKIIDNNEYLDSSAALSYVKYYGNGNLLQKGIFTIHWKVHYNLYANLYCCVEILIAKPYMYL